MIRRTPDSPSTFLLLSAWVLSLRACENGSRVFRNQLYLRRRASQTRGASLRTPHGRDHLVLLPDRVRRSAEGVFDLAQNPHPARFLALELRLVEVALDRVQSPPLSLLLALPPPLVEAVIVGHLVPSPALVPSLVPDPVLLHLAAGIIPPAVQGLLLHVAVAGILPAALLLLVLAETFCLAARGRLLHGAVVAAAVYLIPSRGLHRPGANGILLVLHGRHPPHLVVDAGTHLVLQDLLPVDVVLHLSVDTVLLLLVDAVLVLQGGVSRPAHHHAGVLLRHALHLRIPSGNSLRRRLG